MRKKYVCEEKILNENIHVEDGGCARIYEFDGFSENLFVVLHSWNNDHAHREMDSFLGKTVRVTVEVI